MEEMLVNYSEFTGGLDTASSIDNMAPNTLRKAINADFTTLGAVKTRPKIARWISDAVTKAIPYRSNTLNINYLMCQIGAALVRVDEDGNKVTLMDNCNLKAGITFWSPSLGKDIFIFADGTTLRKYDGAAVTLLSDSAPNGKYLALHKNRLMVAGIPTAPEAVFIAAVGDPEDFATEVIPIRIPTWRGDAILSIVEYLDRLYVFMQHSIHIITGDVIEDFTTSPVVNNIGCLCESAVGTNGANIVFIGNDKRVYEFDGTTLSDVSSEKVKPCLDSLEGSKLSEVSVYPFGAEVHFLLPQKDGTTAHLIYDITRSIWTNWEISGIINVSTRTVDGVDKLLILTASGAFDIGDSQGSDEFATPAAVPIILEFRPMGIDTPSRRKKFKRLFFGVKSSNAVTVSYATDTAPNVQIVLASFVPTSEETVIRLPSVKGRWLYLYISGSNDFELTGISAHGMAKNPK